MLAAGKPFRVTAVLAAGKPFRVTAVLAAGKPFRVTAVLAAGKPFSVASGSFSCMVEVKMVSQESVVDTSAGIPVVSPTTGLVSGTLVQGTIFPSSIGPHAIPGVSSVASKSTLLYGSVI